MPIYEYHCIACGKRFEEILPTSSSPAPPCPKCGAKKPEKLIISLRFVTRFSSEGINVFLRLKKAMAAEETAFKLCEMQPQIREAFKALNLDGAVFEIRNDVDDALDSF